MGHPISLSHSSSAPATYRRILPQYRPFTAFQLSRHRRHPVSATVSNGFGFSPPPKATVLAVSAANLCRLLYTIEVSLRRVPSLPLVALGY